MKSGDCETRARIRTRPTVATGAASITTQPTRPTARMQPAPPAIADMIAAGGGSGTLAGRPCSAPRRPTHFRWLRATAPPAITATTTLDLDLPLSVGAAHHFHGDTEVDRPAAAPAAASVSGCLRNPRRIAHGLPAALGGTPARRPPLLTSADDSRTVGGSSSAIAFSPLRGLARAPVRRICRDAPHHGGKLQLEVRGHGVVAPQQAGAPAAATAATAVAARSNVWAGAPFTAPGLPSCGDTATPEATQPPTARYMPEDGCHAEAGGVFMTSIAGMGTHHQVDWGSRWTTELPDAPSCTLQPVCGAVVTLASGRVSEWSSVSSVCPPAAPPRKPSPRPLSAQQPTRRGMHGHQPPVRLHRPASAPRASPDSHLSAGGALPVAGTAAHLKGSAAPTSAGHAQALSPLAASLRRPGSGFSRYLLAVQAAGPMSEPGHVAAVPAATEAPAEGARSCQRDTHMAFSRDKQQQQQQMVEAVPTRPKLRPASGRARPAPSAKADTGEALGCANRRPVRPASAPLARCSDVAAPTARQAQCGRPPRPSPRSPLAPVLDAVSHAITTATAAIASITDPWQNGDVVCSASTASGLPIGACASVHLAAASAEQPLPWHAGDIAWMPSLAVVDALVSVDGSTAAPAARDHALSVPPPSTASGAVAAGGAGPTVQPTTLVFSSPQRPPCKPLNAGSVLGHRPPLPPATGAASGGSLHLGRVTGSAKPARTAEPQAAPSAHGRSVVTLDCGLPGVLVASAACPRAFPTVVATASRVQPLADAAARTSIGATAAAAQQTTVRALARAVRPAHPQARMPVAPSVPSRVVPVLTHAPGTQPLQPPAPMAPHAMQATDAVPAAEGQWMIVLDGKEVDVRGVAVVPRS